jgi:hypothetical protein
MMITVELLLLAEQQFDSNFLTLKRKHYGQCLILHIT